jgi:uncharacterized LabA/DUF88 family protein
VRHAIFVDAGYLFAMGSDVLSGKKLPRTSVELNQAAIVEKLCRTAEDKAAGSLLRIYWYDGVLPEGPSSEQMALADADWVKLRLGVVNFFGQQKGVDSLIVTDLVELARNQAISDAVLLSGDEDVRIGVQIAQSFGVRVHLIGIGSTGASQARTLMQEADTTSEWDKDDIREIMELKSGYEVSPCSKGTHATQRVDIETSGKLAEVVDEIVKSLSAEEVGKVARLEKDQQVPNEYDGRLLGASRSRIGRNLHKSEKRFLRDRFKQAAQAALPSS